jgi:septal ring factor EnvC (AmiA/AmiB activator)
MIKNMKMDSLVSKLSSLKINVAVLICVVLIFITFALNQCSGNNQLKSDISKMRKELKKDYDERIKKRELIINDLRKDNQSKRIEIQGMNNKIDSLDKVKSKIHIKYVDRIMGIKIMDSEKIKNYWGGEFNAINPSNPSVIVLEKDTLVCFTIEQSKIMGIWNEQRKECLELSKNDSLKINELEKITTTQTDIISNLEKEIINHNETIEDKDKLIGICEDENKTLSKQIKKQKRGKFIAIIGGVSAVILAILIVT